jgi:hypothetical protein
MNGEGRPGGGTETANKLAKADTESIAIVGQLARRRHAARGMVPLDCGCQQGSHSDPMSCLCTFPPLTDNQLEGWRDAALPPMTTGIHDPGRACKPQAETMSRSSDGYLIVCTQESRSGPNAGYWQHFLGPIE